MAFASRPDLATRLRQYRAYRRTVAELGTLRRGELADLGISSHDIVAVARRTVYGR